MKKGATTQTFKALEMYFIIALRNEKGSYNIGENYENHKHIIALRNEKGSYPFLRKN